MQWHWGNIGSAVGGLAALIAVIFAVYGIVKYGPGWLRDSRERQQAQAAAASAEADLAREQAEQIRLERQRGLHGWSRSGVDTFTVTLVTSTEEMDHAREQLLSGGPSGYAILRVEYGQVNRALHLRQIVETEALIARPPTTGELEALEAGLRELGIPKAAHA